MAVDPALRRQLVRTATAIAKNTTERDRLIGVAYKAGGTLREIARAVGLTHPGVLNILRRDGVHDST